MEAVAIGCRLAKPSAHADGDTGQEGDATNPSQAPKVPDGPMLQASNLIGERLVIYPCSHHVHTTSLGFAPHLPGLMTWS